MSRQINFFADSEDAEELRQWLLQAFPGLQAIVKERGPLDELREVQAQKIINTSSTVFLVPQWATERVSFVPLEDGVFRVDYFASPVIEYTASVLSEEKKSLSQGRFFWAYIGNVSPYEQGQVNSLFRWIYAHTIPVQTYRNFRVFEAACRNERILDFGYGIEQVSPHWK